MYGHIQRRDYDPGECDVVAVVKDVPAGRAMGALASVGKFRPTPYPGVIAGRLTRRTGAQAGHTDAQSALVDAAARRPDAFVCVARVTPLDVIVPFERDDVTETLCLALAEYAQPVLGRSFHVRARLRGMKGRVESHAVERAIGGYLCDIAERAGRPASVTFDDPDVILMIQVLGCKVGFSFLGREVRDLEFVRPR